ncbi:uncharacterized protein C11orf97 homolog isoform X1 [Anser cygnoides]|uniref:uncharacterized protein C11orf97 homolog isoform X1 n=1 Tax=Anser cygnoides TaxID=8845 RepID=UPI0034D1DC71
MEGPHRPFSQVPGSCLASLPWLSPPFESSSAPLLGKKFVYVEPSRRVKEILQEELYFQKEEYHIKHPAAVALEGIWSLKKNFSIGGLKPASQNRNGLLLQPQFYSRHAGMKTTVELTAVSTEWFNHGSPICVYCTEKSVWSLGHRATAWAG